MAIPADLAARLEEAYVGLRRTESGLDETQFSQILNLAKYPFVFRICLSDHACRLLSKTHLASEMAWEHWEEALAIFQSAA